MDELFEVLSSTEDILKSILSQNTEISEAELSKKLHTRYFSDYFGEIGVSTIVVEFCYIDHDYVEDHAEYYVRCFHKYKRKCTRLHFFKNQFTTDDFRLLLSGKEGSLNPEILQENYLGFVVVKPLPITIIGRTCLSTYPHDGRRYFPITRSYKANLFGIPLEVEKSLAFQEQDTAVAACATSALWSLFQGTGMLFQHSIPSPSAITKAATKYITDSNRTRAFPSRGLDVIEMARAIKDVNLEPNAIKVSNEYILKGTSYAYMRMGIPMILGFPIYDISVDPHKFKGKHAVALTGYSLPESNPAPFGPRGFRLKANRIDKLYAHDDQIGPFARMEFDGIPVILKDGDGNDFPKPSLSTSWPGENAINAGRAIAEVLVIPLYHKIRIPYGVIHDLTMEIDILFEHAFLTDQNKKYDPSGYEWDIYLTTVNEVKTEYLSLGSSSPDERFEMLVTGMPRYLWRATLEFQGEKLVDIFFDATELEQGSCANRVICNDSALSKHLAKVVLEKDVEDVFSDTRVWPIIELMRSQIH